MKRINKRMRRKAIVSKLAAAAVAAAMAVSAVPAAVHACGYSIDVSSNVFTVDSCSYVISDSSSRYLSAEELYGYSSLYLMLARNEIYARHGYMFKDPNIQRYFNYKNWYLGTVPAAEFSDAVFNDYEMSNISAIVAEENRRGGAAESLYWFD